MSDAIQFEERGAVFEAEGRPLVGVLSLPPRPAALGVLIVVGGPQYRAGSHRQFVDLAWSLAAAGHAVLRFDHRGMGDSDGEALGFEAIDADLRAGVDYLLSAQPGLAGVCLWGLCDGASAALMYAPADPRVSALALANPWARGAETAARTRLGHYYIKRLMSADTWRRALTGRLRLGQSAGELAGSVRQALTVADPRKGDYRQQMVSALAGFGGPTLWLLSGQDFTAREFELFMGADPARRALLDRPGSRRIDIAGADHTFSSPWAEAQVAVATIDWLKGLESRRL
jgi:exosortase A-associated hydrolase 1